MSVRLHPSFLRAAASVLVLLAALAAAAYFWEGYHDHNWWTRGYWISLLVLFPVMVAFVCLAAVPSHLEFTDTHLTLLALDSISGRGERKRPNQSLEPTAGRPDAQI